MHTPAAKDLIGKDTIQFSSDAQLSTPDSFYKYWCRAVVHHLDKSATCAVQVNHALRSAENHLSKPS